jgi:hypothetical protein
MNCPRRGLINPETAQRCDCGYDFVSKSVERPHLGSSPNASLSKIAIGVQLVAIILAGGAVLWGCCMVYTALYPGASGEFGGYSVLFAGVVDMPVGLASLVVGLEVKKGRPALRRACVVLSVVAFAMPFLTKAAWHSQFFRIK